MLACGLDRLPQLGIQFLRDRLREEKSELRPPAWRGLHFDLAVVQLDDPEHHRETDPTALFLGGEIQVEDARQILGRNPDTGVFDRERDAAPRPDAAPEPER